MRPMVRLSLGAALIAVTIVRLAAVGSGVHITNIAPASGRAEDLVTITGRGFGDRNATITIGGARATILTAAGDRITFRVPAGLLPGTTSVTVTNPGGQSGSI